MKPQLLKKDTSAKASFGRQTTIQPKLMVNRPGDVYEQEAEAAEKEIMTNGNSLITQHRGEKTYYPGRENLVMRYSGEGTGFSVSPSMAANINATKGSGAGLQDHTRNFMQDAFSADFSSVRIHDDQMAAQMNRQIGAKAFTYGNDVYFNSGQYNPHTLEGKKLLTHELTHVRQQSDVTGNQMIMRSPESQTITTADGHNVPSPLIVGWSEPFKLSFGARTTSYGDVLFQVRFTYLGGQEPERFSDKEYLWEQDPGLKLRVLGQTHSRKINARILGHSNEYIEVDVFGDESVVYFFVDNLETPKTSGARNHRIEVYLNNQRATAGIFTMSFTAPGSTALKDGGTGTLSYLSPDASNPDEQNSFYLLPTTMLLETCLSRLESLEYMPVSLSLLYSHIKTDLVDPEIDYDNDMADRAYRLNEMLFKIGPVFTVLAAMMKPEQYVGELANDVVAELQRITALYTDAVLESYDSSTGNEALIAFGVPVDEPNSSPMIVDSLALAEEAFSKFPWWLNNLYLKDPRGVSKLIGAIPAMQQELLTWRENNTGFNYTRTFRRGDEMVQSYPWMNRTPTLTTTLNSRKDDIEQAWRRESDYVNELIHRLYFDIQVATGLITAMTLYEQATYFRNQLTGSLINDVIEVVRKDQEDIARKDANDLHAIVMSFEKLSYEKDADEKNSQVIATLQSLRTVMENIAPHFEGFQDRLKWVNRIDVLAKLVVIIAAAALTAGVASSVAAVGFQTASVGAGYALAGELLIGGLAFTATSRLGENIFFGKAEGSFVEGWFWNTLTLGVLKGAGAVYSKFANISKEATRLSKMGHGLGKAGTAVVSLHAFSVLQHGITTGKWMTRDQHVESLLQNVILTVALSATGFMTAPIEKRMTRDIALKLNMDKRIKVRIDKLQTERQSLEKKLEELKHGEGRPADLEVMIKGSEKLWREEVKILNDAAGKGIIKKAELARSLEGYSAHIQHLQLNLAKIGITLAAPGGTGFIPMQAGVIGYTPKSKAAIEKAYAADPTSNSPGPSLVESKTRPGILEGRMPNGEITYFVPVAEAAFLPGKAPTSAAGVTKFLGEAGFTKNEITALGNAGATRLGPRTAERVAQLLEHFTVADLHVLAKYLSGRGLALNDGLITSLIEMVPPGSMKSAVKNLEIAEIRAEVTGEIVDTSLGTGISIRQSGQGTRKRNPLEAKFDPVWKMAEVQAFKPLTEMFGTEGWQISPRIQAPGAAKGEALGSTVPEYYHPALNKAFEVKRLNLEELGVGKKGQEIGKPSKASGEALARARTQLAARQWNIPGAEQNIIFNITGQGVTDIVAVGKQIKKLLGDSLIRYDKVFVQNRYQLIEIP